MGIKLLPEGVWARIAAGEVVERPASAVKEMIENSLDAGSRRIRVKLWDGGRVRIVVEDDGAGIAFDELSLALTPHATSKIGGIDDLEAIHTLGYRGEALASLAAVGRVEIRSRPADAPGSDAGNGGMIRAYEGRVADHARTNCVPGTRVQVDELFANLPARRKFLKSASGELRRVTAILREYAICRPEVGFALEHDGRPVFSTDGGGDRRRVIEQLWGARPEIFTAPATAGRIALECWWQPRQGRSEVISFVNGRAVTDPVIKGALNTAARELTGGWALLFSIDPSLIDVNIHPAKAEIRFRYPNEVFEAVKEASAQLGGPANFSGFSPAASAPVNPVSRSETQGRDFKTSEEAPIKRDSQGTQSLEWGPGQSPGTVNQRFSDFGAPSPEPAFTPPRPAASRDSASASYTVTRPERLFGRIEIPEISGNISGIPDLPPPAEDSVYLGQLRSGYLVFDVSEDGDGPGELALVDPHAAHERVAYERIRAAAETGSRSQRLLIPALLPPTLQLEAEEKKELLEKAGFALEESDGGLCLTAAPSFAGLDSAEISPEALLRASLSVLRDTENGEASPAERLWRTWATMACKSAVKLAAELLPPEALALWRDLRACERPFVCPHGRPTVLKFSRADLAKHFGRE